MDAPPRPPPGYVLIGPTPMPDRRPTPQFPSPVAPTFSPQNPLPPPLTPGYESLGNDTSVKILSRGGGNGAAMNLVVNMIMGSMMASFSEALLVREKVGLDPKFLLR